MLALLCLVATSCQVRSRIEVSTDLDGAGKVAVEVGLDDEALDRLGDPEEGLALDDLADAGWTVTGPTPRDGHTWWRAEKPFTDPAGLEATLAEVAGPDVVISGMAYEVTDVDGGDEHRLGGHVDVSGGLAVLAEPALTETLGGDPFGGYVTALEADEGRPVSEMVTLEVVASVDGERSVVTVRPGDPPTQVAATRFVEDPMNPWPWVLAGVGTVVLVSVVVVAATRLRRRSQPVGA